MSRFVESMLSSAQSSTRGLVTGEPGAPVRSSWGEVHQRARQVAGGLASLGVGPGDRVGVLAGAPVEIAPTAQGVWLCGACLTMLQQPTPRTDLQMWAQDTLAVITMIEATVVIVSDPFMAVVAVLAAHGVRVVTIAELLGAAPIEVVGSGEDDLALLQLTSGSTGCVKAVAITHANVISNAEAMFVGAHYDIDTDVIVSWLPLFHDMGMTGFLTMPMLFGGELVKVTPIDFMDDILLWPKLIDKYGATMTAAPNFAYTLLAKRLRRHARLGDFDLSSLRWALSGAEQVEPADVEDLCAAAAPFGLRPEAILPAYGMAETTVAVSFSQCGNGLIIDEVDADMLAVLRQAVPATTGNTRRLATLGPVLHGIQARIVDEDGALQSTRGVGLIEVRGDAVTSGYVTAGGFVAVQDGQGWFSTGDLGYLTEQDHIVVCGRAKDVIIMAGRNIYPTDVERAAGRVAGVRAGCVAAVRLDASHSRESFAVAVESSFFDDPAQVRRIKHEVAHEVVSEVAARPRNVVVLAPGAIPKTPSGKLRRACALSLVT
ncbi:fatty acyl-AMP ligase [Mycobacterium haemophilum]|uniref:Long-chain fatty acid--CoA ligase n=1 Tax=Mycobacterium haemophilum TaxID=29311 RepID=A0A0I9VIB7_9MYCO|nr:fatty acyl-AMP ligase [Mycobacterium haemophilum]KLO29914.1 long-chain fatty acid--CoA ligase [Mycobacterium haemophilum]KLO38496.1 long-chain fatty acid--CoA ligase [Mycobacterium haemophilum]KLO44830.1 long-chain fatty acid--CoA ligase [Mycobacterium haemophilum]KLO56173.1 long-chain fatty acid--CoA ligase [Mycobacterium haemophilum]